MRRNFFHALFILFCFAVLFTASSSHAHVLTSATRERIPDTMTAASVNHTQNVSIIFTKHDTENMRQIRIRTSSSQEKIQNLQSSRKDSELSAETAHKTRLSEIHPIISQRK